MQPLHGADAGHVGRAPEPRRHSPARFHLRTDDHGIDNAEERRQPARLAVHNLRSHTLRVQSRNVRHLLGHRLVPAADVAPPLSIRFLAHHPRELFRFICPNRCLLLRRRRRSPINRMPVDSYSLRQ